MSLWSGQSSSYSALADLICGYITEQDVVNILDKLIGPQIGEVKYCANLAGMRTTSSSGNITSKDDLPEDFDGWIRANGVMISREMFPEMALLLDSIDDYPGKASSPDGKLVAVPNLTGMIRLNPASNQEQPFQYQSGEYSMPDHTHTLGDIKQQGSAEVQTIKRAAWIWSALAGVTGKMPDTYWHGLHIPESPCVHCGNITNPTIVNWDIPVEARYNKGSARFAGDTGTASLEFGQCFPARAVIPVQIFIGKYIQKKSEI